MSYRLVLRNQNNDLRSLIYNTDKNKLFFEKTDEKIEIEHIDIMTKGYKKR